MWQFAKNQGWRPGLIQASCWGTDVSRGKTTDLQGAIQATDDQTVAFSWIEWPSKAARDEGNAMFMKCPQMQQFSDLPVDGKRMIFDGFE